MKMQVVNCPNCNGEVQIDSSRDFGFCTFCGTKVLFTKDAPQNAMEAFTTNRDAALKEINRLNKHFASVSDLYNKIDLISQHIDDLDQKSYTGCMVWGIISATIGVIVLINRNWLVGSVFILIGAMLFVLRFLLNKKCDQEFYEAIDQKKRWCKEVADMYWAYPHCPIGIEYCRPEIIQSLYDYIRQGRAETIKEAVNLMAADARYKEMRKIALDTMNYAEMSATMSAINAFTNITRGL